MKFDHRVKFKGILYDVGQDVPLENEKAVEKANTKPQAVSETILDSDFGKYMNEPVKTTEISYTKTEINRMPTADLKKLASDNGIDDGLSGAEIKKALIKKFGL